ncbi:MAG: aminodeoxychorismate/anthranilate synthase component II [Deltaproteobacteria bacterium]|nr:aminodeoxychorismate/anthranilate synthase component II [Deltaproteobacteria bacterium]
MILMIDNYDSFTYNLVQYIGQLGGSVVVHRNDQISLDEIRRLQPDAIVISPGPCTPKEAGISVELIRQFSSAIPILGVCLGHQAIGYAFGGEVVSAERIMHGKTSQIINDGRTIFQGLPNPFVAGRYHSLIVEKSSLPACLEISAATEQGEIMGIRHKEYRVEGIQFHPESVLTPNGKRILKNFLAMIDKAEAEGGGGPLAKKSENEKKEVVS